MGKAHSGIFHELTESDVNFLYCKGSMLLHFVRVQGWRALVHRILYGSSPIWMHIETPLNHGYTPGSVSIRGWAFSYQGEIRQIEVKHRGKIITMLRPHQPRPDVSDHFGYRGALYSGFESSFRLPSGRQTLIIQVMDVKGNWLDKRIKLHVGKSPSSQLMIDHATWREGSLTIEGWALWVGSNPPRIVRCYLDGKVIGESPCNLSRPEISGRYPTEIAAYCRGFRLTEIVSPLGHQAELRVEIQDRSGNKLEQTLTIQHEGQYKPSVYTELQHQLALYGVVVNPAPEILDWHTGVQGKFPTYNMFTPPTNEGHLPYFDASVDMVIYSDESHKEEALRVAREAVIYVGKHFIIEWKSQSVPQLPRVSIIIPVFNRSEHTRKCLDELRKTLPLYFNGEVIVADDASTDNTQAMLSAYAAVWSQLKIVRREQNSGFILNCNGAAHAADGEYLLFLNNDTLPQAGWFEALLMTFSRFPEAGAVGGKLINPDGTLQEAGSAVVTDGRTLNFGADDPAINHPLYHHVREVHYCSAALLMTPRSIFNEIGGFDPQFQPAYFEDVDYCFNVRANGYQVLYQPESVVVHTGHASYKDSAQLTGENRQKFLNKWSIERSRLLFTETNPYVLVDIQRRRRALVYANRMPEFDRFGGLLRLYYLINVLIDSGWAVTFYGRDITGAERYADLLRQRGVMVYGGDLSRGIDDNYLPDAASLLQSAHFELAVLHLWQTAEPLLPLLRAYSPETRIIVDSSDVHFVREARALFAEQKKLDPIFAQGMMGEMNVYAAADTVLAVSESEACIINSLVGKPEHAHIVPNMIETTPSPFAFSERRGIVFIGNYVYPPNIEAVTYLIEEVLPFLPAQLLEKHPLFLIGHHAHEALGALVDSHKNVCLVGWVPDARLYLQQARIAVAPLLNGAGTKTKLITALANRTPVVSTWIGAEGLDIRHEQEVLIADTAQTFATGIQRLLTDEALWNRLATAGHEYIHATHGYETGKRRFVQVINTLFGRSSSSG